MTEVLTRGLKEIQVGFRRMAPDVRKAYIAAVNLEAGRIMTASLKECPIDTSNLRNSHFQSTTIKPDGVEVLLGYRADYAVIVHEVPPSGDPHATHKPPTKWKYLEDPLKLAMAGFSERVALAVQAILSRGSR